MQNGSVLAATDCCEDQVVKVRIDSLSGSDSPRLSGEDSEHVRALTAVEDTLPPILVHRSSMRVIDGMHRLRAAKLRGQSEIDVRFFDGDEASCFVLAVESNILHGLPLSLADRKAAASRILKSYPHWSDRRIASATGIAAKTVASIRGCLGAEDQHMDSRVGRDGRVRPTDSDVRRMRATKLIVEKPDASLRQIARETGVSPETVRTLRSRLHNGRPAGIRRDGPVGRAANGGNGQPSVQGSLIALRSELHPVSRPSISAVSRLMADPALRSTDTGRALLRMLATSSAIEHNQLRIVAAIPAHCLPRVAEAAMTCAELWRELAQRLEQLNRTQSYLVR